VWAIDSVAISAQAGKEPGSSHMIAAAHEFEGQLMKELLRPMTTSDNEDDPQAGFCGAMTDFAAEALGQALSSRGGFGIATSILHSFSESGVHSRDDPSLGMGITGAKNRLK